jgi:hypothetical protein
MTVKELIDALSKFDSNLPVLVLAGWDGLHSIEAVNINTEPQVVLDCEPV